MRARVSPALVGTLILAATVTRPAASQARPLPTEPVALPRPSQFHLTAGVVALQWEAGAGRDGNGAMFSVSRRVLKPLAVRTVLATVTGDGVAGSDRPRARHYLVLGELAVAPVIPLGQRWTLLPGVGVGIGVTISDPAPDTLATKSQNTWTWTARLGVGLPGPWTAEVRYHGLAIRRQDLAAAAPSVGTRTTAAAWSFALGVFF